MKLELGVDGDWWRRRIDMMLMVVIMGF